MAIINKIFLSRKEGLIMDAVRGLYEEILNLDEIRGN